MICFSLKEQILVSFFPPQIYLFPQKGNIHGGYMQTIDLRGLCSPANFARARHVLKMIANGETVEILFDDEEPVMNILPGLKEDGHILLAMEGREGCRVLAVKVHASDNRTVTPFREYRSLKITGSGSEAATDPVMVEENVELVVNGSKFSSLVTSPGSYLELAVGHLVTEGLVKDLNDIEDVMAKDGRVFVNLRSNDRSGLSKGTGPYAGLLPDRDKVDKDLILPVSRTFRIDVLLDSIKNLYDVTQDLTGGAHSASLVDDEGNQVHKALDIGRHNAVDKVVGMAFLNGADLTKLFLVSSGRQPAAMVMKAVSAGIPMIISKSAPVSTGIDCALRHNITLCCFATTEKAKVFSAPERIIWG